jgi:hypothetical protein
MVYNVIEVLLQMKSITVMVLLILGSIISVFLLSKEWLEGLQPEKRLADINKVIIDKTTIKPTVRPKYIPDYTKAQRKLDESIEELDLTNYANLDSFGYESIMIEANDLYGKSKLTVDDINPN